MITIADEINSKIKESCRRAAEEMIRKAWTMEPIPAFSYRRPELRRKPGLLANSLEKSSDKIRSAFGVTE